MPGTWAISLGCILPLLVSGATARALGAQSSWTCESDIIFQGTTAFDHRGFTIATGGNWNGDAYISGEAMNDVLVGGYQSSPFESGSAELWISTPRDRLGQDLGFSTGNPRCPYPAAPIRIVGEQAGDMFGLTVAFLGDLDGDERDDFAIGMSLGPVVRSTPIQRGGIYVFLSTDGGHGIPREAPSGPSTVVVNAADASVIIAGEAAGHRFGRSIASIGDWEGDGDGVPEFLVGAPGTDTGSSGFPGRVYMISGGKVVSEFQQGNFSVNVDEVLVDVALEPFAVRDGILQGDANEDRFGHSVAHLGEGGDTAHGSDFVVGAPQYNDTADNIIGHVDNSTNPGGGYVKVFLGASAHPMKIVGPPQAGCRFGMAVSGGANVDGDAGDTDELLVGAPFWDSATASDVGKVFVINAVSGTVLSEDEGLPAVDPLSAERLGWRVTGLRDLNGDVRDEFAVGSFGFGSTPTGEWDPPSTSPCAPCPKIDPVTGFGRPVGGGISGRAQIYSYDGSSLSSLAEYVGDARDSAGSEIAFLPAVGPNADFGIVVGAFRWGESTPTLNEVGRAHVFPWRAALRVARRP